MKLNDAKLTDGNPGRLPLRALRIALVTETYPPEINGVAMTLGWLANALRESGHSVEVVRPAQRKNEMTRRGDNHGEVLVKGLPIPGYAGLNFGLPATGRLKSHWRHRRPDIVYIATQGPLGWSARRAARALDLPVSSGFHTNFDAYSRHYGIGWMRGAISSLLRGFHNGTDATLVPTRSLARALSLAGYRNVDVLSRGIDTQLFNPQRRSPQLRAGWGAHVDDLVVAYIGRIAPEKNLGLVFAAFDEIRRVRHGAKLVLVGDGPSLTTLRTRYPQHLYPGAQRGEALAAHYASADLFLFPSLTETFGNVTLEALASGLGVVGYDYAAAAELIEDGHNGMLAAPGDANGFIHGAVALATDRPLLARVRLRASASVAHLEWSRVGDAFATKLHGLISAHERKQRARNALAITLD